MKRRICLGILALTLVFSIALFASPPTEAAFDVSAANETQLRAAVTQAGTTPATITLTADIELTSSLVILFDADITFRSSDTTMFSLIATRDMDVIELLRGSSVVIENIGITRTSGTRGTGVRLRNAALTMNDGLISNHTDSGVSFFEGTFTMNGGTISNNTAISSGGGVSGSIAGYGITMNGGTISDNSAPNGGGIWGSVVMNGGTITGNTATTDGGGVYGYITMHGGTISNNTATGIIIANNIQYGSGGGVHVHGDSIMTGGTINNNTAQNGGGVSVGVIVGSFTMQGGTIHNNTAENTGGGVHNMRFFTMEGGWIFDNIAPTDSDHYSISTGTFNNNIITPADGAIGSGPPTPEQLTVMPTASTVLVNGIETAFEAYLINNNNYFKLRDLAHALNGTDKQFEVGYDSATGVITMTSGVEYTALGGEMQIGDGTSKTATHNVDIDISRDGVPVDITAYLIAGNNFMRLRDVMQLLDIYVGYDEVTGNITIDTTRSYSE